MESGAVTMGDDRSETTTPAPLDLRRMRRLKAVQAMARSIHNCNCFRWRGALREDESRNRVVEIRDMLAVLKAGDLSGYDEQSTRNALLSSVGPGAEYRQFSSALDAFERALAAQLVVLSTSLDNDAQELGELRETALLAKLTEKFYGSGAFRIIAGGLVAAAFLAGSGMIFLGGHAVILLHNLNSTADEASKNIMNISTVTQNLLDKQVNQLGAARDATDKAYKEFQSEMKGATKDVKGCR